MPLIDQQTKKHSSPMTVIKSYKGSFQNDKNDIKKQKSKNSAEATRKKFHNVEFVDIEIIESI